MVLIKPSIHTSSKSAGGYLSLCAPGMDNELRVEFRSNDNIKDRVKVRVWDDHIDALDEGDIAADWISEYLGTPCRLVIRDPLGYRVSEDGVVDKKRAFTDQYSVMIMTTESISDVNRRIEERNGSSFVSELNFRSNVYVTCSGSGSGSSGSNDSNDDSTSSSSTPYQEDSWRDIRINGCEFRFIKRCTRCRLPNVDPMTGIVSEDHNPLKTLMAYRRVDEAFPNHAVLGIQVEHLNEGMISVGDEVYVKQC